MQETMDTISLIHYDDQQSLYTPLEPVCLTALPILLASSEKYSNGANSTTTYPAFYSYSALNYTELPLLQSTMYSHLKDEGIGSLSPASSHRSSNNSSPISAASSHPMQSGSSIVINNSPMYTPFEPVYPSALLSPPTSNEQYISANPTTTHPAIYSYSAPISAELSLLQSTLYSHVKDEGIGLLSPASSHRSSNSSSPISGGSSPVNFHSAHECDRCTKKDAITFFNGHNVCSKCFPEVSSPIPTIRADEPPVFSIQQNGNKRKRLSMASGSVCSNCNSTLSTQWRNSSTGEKECNACWLYEKQHQCARPKCMRKDTIQTRERKNKSSKSSKAIKTLSGRIASKEDKEAIIKEIVEEGYQHLHYYQSIQEPLFSFPPYAMEEMEKIFGNFLS